MLFKSQDPKLFKRFKELAGKQDEDRFFKFFGVLWFLESIKWEAESQFRTVTFEAELRGVIMATKPKRKTDARS